MSTGNSVYTRCWLITSQYTPSTESILTAISAHTTDVNDADIFVLDTGNDSIKIEHTRQLIEWAGKKPFAAESKAAVILNAEQLTVPAQNALLKLLEEPPAHTQIALATTVPSQLLFTIRSRLLIANLDSSKEASSSKDDDFWQLNYLQRRKALDKLKNASRVELRKHLEQLAHNYITSGQAAPDSTARISLVLKNISANGNINLALDVFAGIN